MAKSDIGRIKKALKQLEANWPTDGTMIMANGNFLYLCTKHPQDGGKVIESFHIPNDGGDPDWEKGQDVIKGPKRLVKFKEPRGKVVHVGPRPPFVGKPST